MLREAGARFAERVAFLAPKLGLSAEPTTPSIGGAPPPPCGPSMPRTAAATSPWTRRRRPTRTPPPPRFPGRAPVVDVQTHFIDPARWDRPSAAPLAGFFRWWTPAVGATGSIPQLIDAAEWATLVFGTSETAVALLTSTPGSAEDNVLTNPQIAAARDIVASRHRRAGC